MIWKRHSRNLVRNWKILDEEEEVGEDVLGVGRLDLPMTLEIVRYIAINDYISLPDSLGWEIEEFEVWGRGYAMAGAYISEWKAPYHNTRACLEIINRTGKLQPIE